MNIKNYCLKKTFLFFCMVNHYGVVGEKTAQNNLKNKDLKKTSTPEIKENTDNKVIHKDPVYILHRSTKKKISVLKMLQTEKSRDVCIMKDPEIKTNNIEIFATNTLSVYPDIVELFANNKEKNFSEFNIHTLYSTLILLTLLLFTGHILDFDPSLKKERAEFLDLIKSQPGYDEESLEQEQKKKGAALFDKIFSNPNLILKVHEKEVNMQNLKHPVIYLMLLFLLKKYYLANISTYMCSQRFEKSHEDVMEEEEETQEETQEEVTY